jgi:NAD(P)H-nitrite reductase large subunit
MSSTHYVIIGNGTCGNHAADLIRKGDKDGRITIISAGPFHYAHRQNLAKYIFREDLSIEDLVVHPPEWYEERKITLRLNQPVVSVNTDEKYLLLAHRERVRYDKLLICSGARHRIPEYLSHFEALLTKFSTEREAFLLKAEMDQIKHVTLLGGDLVGLQLFSVLLPAGKKVTLIMDEFSFWPLEHDKQTIKKLSDAIEKKGVEVIRNDYVTDIEAVDNRKKVKTMGGFETITDKLILCSGLVPTLQYLATSGIDMQEGVLVNHKLESSVKNVWAAGECAQIYHEELKDYRCSSGFQNAYLQGEIAAKNILGGSESALLCEVGTITVAGEEFISYGWKGFTLDAIG